MAPENGAPGTALRTNWLKKQANLFSGAQGTVAATEMYISLCATYIEIIFQLALTTWHFMIGGLVNGL